MAHQYDVSLKLLFRRSRGLVARRLFGGKVKSWLNVELPSVQNPRVDMIAELEDGALHHVELEANIKDDIGRRVAEYYLALHRLLDRHVEMAVLYVGKKPLKANAFFKTKSMQFDFELLDIRDFEGEPLLRSSDLGDNMLALLTPFDHESVMRRVLDRLRKLPSAQQAEAARIFVVISGLRDLEETVRGRLGMIDIMENKVLGPAVLKGEAIIIRAQLEERFGPLPEWVSEKFSDASEKQLMTWAKRVLTAKSLQAVFKR